jgi:hypothetical protein
MAILLLEASMNNNNYPILSLLEKVSARSKGGTAWDFTGLIESGMLVVSEELIPIFKSKGVNVSEREFRLESMILLTTSLAIEELEAKMEAKMEAKIKALMNRKTTR